MLPLCSSRCILSNNYPINHRLRFRTMAETRENLESFRWKLTRITLHTKKKLLLRLVLHHILKH